MFRTLWWAMVVLAVAGIVRPAEACDCVWYAYQTLSRAGIRLATVPAIVGTEGRTGYYRGVVRIHFPEPCMVYVHEFVHHDQWLRGREAPTVGGAEWWELERNAQAVALRAIDNAGECNAAD